MADAVAAQAVDHARTHVGGIESEADRGSRARSVFVRCRDMALGAK
jgi:hypothetical protein